MPSIVRTATGFDKRSARIARPYTLAEMRRTIAALLLVILLPALVIVNASTWAVRTALDDAAFAATVGRVMDTPEVEEAIAARATTAVIDTLDAAPGRLATVSAVVLRLTGEPTREQIAAALEARILAALSVPAVEAARDDAIRAVHAVLLGAATDDDGLVHVDGSQVVLDLGPIVERVAGAVDERLPRAGLANLPAGQTTIVLAEAPQLATVTTTIDILETLRIVLPLALLALIVAILALAHRRRRAVGLIGMAMVVAGIVSLVIAWLGSGVVGRVPDDPVAALIAKGAYDAFVEVLVLQSLLLIALGTFIALVARLLIDASAVSAGARHGATGCADGRQAGLRPTEPRERRDRRRLALDPLDDRGDPLADADAHRGEAVAAAGPAQLVGEHRDEPAAAHPERMAERDRPTVHVHLGGIEPELVDAHERLARERLVELDEIEVVDADPGPFERLARGRHGPDPHDRRVHPGDGRRHHAGQRTQAELAGRVRLDEQDRRRAIVDARAVAGRHAPAFAREGRLQTGEGLGGACRRGDARRARRP